MRKVLYIFGLLTDADVEWIARNGRRRILRDREILIREGRQVESIIFLLRGELRISAQAVGDIARIGVGEIVGEMSFVDSAPPAATVTATGECLALFIDKETVARKIDADPAFGCRSIGHLRFSSQIVCAAPGAVWTMAARTNRGASARKRSSRMSSISRFSTPCRRPESGSTG